MSLRKVCESLRGPRNLNIYESYAHKLIKTLINEESDPIHRGLASAITKQGRADVAAGKDTAHARIAHALAAGHHPHPDDAKEAVNNSESIPTSKGENEYTKALRDSYHGNGVTAKNHKDVKVTRVNKEGQTEHVKHDIKTGIPSFHPVD